MCSVIDVFKLINLVKINVIWGLKVVILFVENLIDGYWILISLIIFLLEIIL